ncbi:fungal-specific transcription factor domain-containing protein [Ampelomyces quisqualis]|uniref:Fungal-specific transcription factor domain-containing protein n=1 Tax=Ampelomyces quisqualis TaxID=50730 RepID=A0A6A5Q971_AMPQU|nr:fungal-specific transcription factor domain-containing protein [Ampelomyces quisqualis]
MRNPVACVSCRSAKQRCLNAQDGQPCDRCKTTGRACVYPQPGTSRLHRQPKRPRASLSEEAVPTRSAATAALPATNSTPAQGRRQDAHVPSGISGDQTPAPSPTPSAAQQLDGLDPFDLLTDEVKNSYLRCSYKWSFHHTPTLLLRIRDRALEPWMAWAMLALAIRFVNDPPPPFATQTAASNAYAAHARQMLQADLETPSISRVQALLMLTGHDWGAGNGRRAWIYLGMAIRLVEVMGLTQELTVPRNRMPTREEFIEAEVRRRTAWTCFLMDSLLSGGKGRKRSLAAADMAVQLPCERESFVFGEATCTERLDSSVHMPPVALPPGDIGIIGYSLRAANVWGKVARWACSDDFKTELPWSPASQFQQLVYELERWKKSLPQRLQYDLFALHSHNAVEQGQAYCYMHCIHFMSYMFLHRAYLPVLGPQQNGLGADETPSSYDEHKDMWKSWQKTCRTELFNESIMVLEMLEEMRTFGVYFLRGLVPWIGFTIYTAVGVMLYCFNFPSNDDDPRLREKARKCVINGCTFLKEMKTQWPMAATWFETIKRMQAYYRSALGQDAPASPEERQALRRAMIDYGALQPTPVQKPTDSSNAMDTSVVASSISPTSSLRETNPMALQPDHNLITPPTPAPIPALAWNTPNAIPPLEADETFNMDTLDFSAGMEETMMNATQDFWGSFPGEVGVGYQ